LRGGGEIRSIREADGEVVVDLDIWQIDDEGTQLGAGSATVAFESG
jgi:hypothetical protein